MLVQVVVAEDPAADGTPLWTTYAKEFRLTPKAAGETLDHVAAAVATWRESAALNGIRAGEVIQSSDAFRLP